MNKFTTCLMTLLTVLLSCAIYGCKEEPEVDFDIDSETDPYGYTDVSVTFACSDIFLEFFNPTFYVVNDTLRMIEPTRNDFKLSEETVSIPLKVEKEDNTEIINRDLMYYQYSINERINTTDENVLILVLCKYKDDYAERVIEMAQGTEEGL